MLFVRVFFVVVVAGAFCALGYAFWLTFEPLDAPPRGEDPPAFVDPSAATVAVVTADVAPKVDVAAAFELADTPQSESVLDRLRAPVRAARAVADDARAVAREVRQVGGEVREALPDAEAVTLENAWRVAKETGKGLADAVAADAALQHIEGFRGDGRVHASGAPPQGGGGPPGTARQPGIDWYKAGGQPVRE